MANYFEWQKELLTVLYFAEGKSINPYDAIEKFNDDRVSILNFIEELELTDLIKINSDGNISLRQKGISLVEESFPEIVKKNQDQKEFFKNLKDSGKFQSDIEGQTIIHDDKGEIKEISVKKKDPLNKDHFLQLSKEYEKLINAAVLQPWIKDVIDSKEFYFRKAQEKFYTFRNYVAPKKGLIFEKDGKKQSIPFYDAAILRLTEFYSNNQGEQKFNQFLSNIGNSQDAKLFKLIGELIAHIDKHASNKEEWNTYDDKRVIARSTVRQDSWAKNLLLFKKNDNNWRVISPSIRNSLKFLDEPFKNLTVLSENHRAKIAEGFLEVKYEPNDFFDQVNQFFNYFNIPIQNPDNAGVVYSRIFYEDEIRPIWEDFDAKISDEEELLEKEYLHENQYLADGHPEKDELKRRDLMEAVYEKVKVYWENTKANDPFTLLINGEWGSGKSTMLDYLKHFLTKEDNWTVVDYNAWRNQRFDDPWWIFVNKVSKEVPSASNITNYESRSHRYWKLRQRHGVTYLATFATSVLLIVGLFNDAFGNPEDIGFYASILALLGSLWFAVNGAIQNIFRKKSLSALAAETANDPLEPYKDRFNEVVKNKKVAIFIDDLDRCEVDATVDLLEGIQTLFKECKVLYVVAADGHWLSNCYDKKYEKFSELYPVGQSVGNQFLQKTFQLIVDVPKLRKPQVKKLLDSYIGSKEEGQISNEPSPKRSVSEEEIKGMTDQEKLRNLAAEGDETTSKAATSQIGKASETEEVRKDLEHFILEFHKKNDLPLNPRQIKRLINMYTMKVQELGISGVSSAEVSNETILRYVIFSTEYAACNQHLRTMDKVDFDKKYKKVLGDFKPLTYDIIRDYF